MKIEYRCANPTAIKAPRQIMDTPKYRISLTPDAIVTLQKAVGAMKCETISVISGDDGVSFELHDENKDKFTYNFADSVQILTDGNGKFKFHYPTKVMLHLLKNNASNYFDVGMKGVAFFDVGEVNMLVLPQV
jgi:hypothetical protein